MAVRLENTGFKREPSRRDRNAELRFARLCTRPLVFSPLLDCATEEGNDLQSGDKNLQQRLETLVSWLRGLWDQSRSAAADPSTHHPQTEKRLGPCSLRMTARLGKLEAIKFGCERWGHHMRGRQGQGVHSALLRQERGELLNTAQVSRRWSVQSLRGGRSELRNPDEQSR